MTIALCILFLAIALLAFAQYVRAEQAIDDRDSARSALERHKTICRGTR